MSVQSRKLFGRKRIFYDNVEVTRENVWEIVTKSLPIHNANKSEIQYLYDVYKGKQEILQKVAPAFSDICNNITVNFANEIVTFKTGYLLGSPVQYVSRGERTSELSDAVSAEINTLNRYSDNIDKAAKDIEIAEWFHICGTAYRFIRVSNPRNEKKSPFEIYTLDPRNAFVVYSNDVDNAPILGVYIVKLIDGTKIYNCWTWNRLFKIFTSASGEPLNIVEEVHYLGSIPIIEYPANNARLGAFEIVLPMLDAINAAFSDLADGREQFINALLVIKGSNIEEEKFKSLRHLGGLLVPPDGDVKYLVSELNQEQNNMTINLMIDTMREIVGMPQRAGSQTSDSSNGVAIVLRNGWSDAESRAADTERIFKKSENELLDIALRICNAKTGMQLELASVEPHFTRKNTENLLAKTQAFTTMIGTGKVHPLLAWQLSGLVSDPESAYMISEEYEQSQIEKEEQLLAESTVAHGHDTGGDAA